jgi:GalNAc-alpha-(1->4)-GalNAc-alpha-(1->3)-diNAcBac-PP-undecaprenol alpha-1,4-N-acetyl-D-galactosaminyltransferase
LKKKICLVLPSITSGGMERVMTLLANYLVTQEIEVQLIVLTKQPHFYELDPRVKITEPDFTIDQMSRIRFKVKNFFYLRHQLRAAAKEVLSFGGKYNSFVLLAAWGLNKRVFISDRSRPSISYGRFLDLLNNLMYRTATGIIAQTNRAKDVLFNRIGHHNIRVIPNPIRQVQSPEPASKEKIILTVGRLIPSKKHDWLLRIFAKTNNKGWKLVILGEGQMMDSLTALSKELGITGQVVFPGNQKNIDDYYNSATIFAFTSVSEGFPNALAEAMTTPLPCVAFDCEAGPADLIADGKNGYLVKEGDLTAFQHRLQQLMEEEPLREKFRAEASRSAEALSLEKIGDLYSTFILVH